MKVTMNRTVGNRRGTFVRGRVYDLPDATATSWVARGAAEAVDAAAPADGDSLNDLKVAELRERAAARDLPTSGTKAELVARLRDDGDDL